MVGATRLHTFLCRQDNRSGNYRSSKDGRGRTKPCGTCDERAVKKFQVDKLLPDTRFLGQSQEFEKRFGK